MNSEGCDKLIYEGKNITVKQKNGDFVRMEKEVFVRADEYSQLKRAFMGGHTHANARYVGKVLEYVGSQDFTSSYPAVMLLERYPMSKVHTVDDKNITENTLKELLRKKCCLFDIKFYNIREKLKFEHPISSSKCWLLNGAVRDNGRVVSANELGTTITEQDLKTFIEFYTWDHFKISNFRYYDTQYLPRAFARAILGLYEKKTTLKDVVGEEVNYMIYKNMLNSSFGMTVTDIVREFYEYQDYICKPVKPILSEALEKYNNNIRRFLFYPWGVWITAYARRNLFTGIKEIGEDFVYSDTDSIKYLHPERHEEYFKNYNAQIMEKIKKAAAYFRVEESAFSPLNKKGKPKTIGLWDYEGTYRYFKTLGAKRYAYQFGEETKLYDKETGEGFYVTIAGANKSGTAKYLLTKENPFDAFDNDLRIPEQYAKRLVATYIDEEHSGWVTDYLGTPYYYTEASGLHLEPSEYNLTMSDEFINFLKGVRDIDW